MTDSRAEKAVGGPWERWRDDVLLRDYDPDRPGLAAEAVGRPAGECVARAAALRPCPPWSRDRPHYPDLSGEPRLTGAEVAALLTDRTPAAEDLAVRGSLRMAIWLADRSRLPLPPGELFSAAAEGLLYAVRRFDPSKGFAFSTYATRYMRGYMVSAARDGSRLVRVPRHGYAAAGKIARGEEVTAGGALAAAALDRRVASLSGDADARGLPEPAAGGPDPGEAVAADDLASRVRRAVDRCGLTDAEREAVLNQLDAGAATQAELARDGGVTRQVVTHRLRKARAKLRRHLAARGWGADG